MSITDNATFEQDTIKRRMSWTWDFPGMQYRNEKDMHVQVEFTVRHYKEGREYRAELSRRGCGGGIITVHIDRGEYLTVLRDPTARYSAKTLERFAQDALRVLEIAIATNEKYAALMSGLNFMTGEA